MSDEHHGATLLLLQTDNEIENRMSVFAVEITGRFIREEQRWPVSQTPSDRDSLSLATGKFGWEMIESMSRPTSFSNSTARSRRSETDRSISNIGIWTFSTAVKSAGDETLGK
jgi:hypothetical protein